MRSKSPRNRLGRFKTPDFSQRFRRLLRKKCPGSWRASGLTSVLEHQALDIARLAFRAGMIEGFRWVPPWPGRATVRQVGRKAERLWWGLP